MASGKEVPSDGPQGALVRSTPRPALDTASALAEAEALGVDLDHLRHNLTLTPAQRLEKLQAGLRLWQTLQLAGRRRDVKLAQAPSGAKQR